MKVLKKSRRLLGMSLVLAMFMVMLGQINIGVTHATLAIEGKDNTPTPTGMQKPDKGDEFTDPTYGTSVTRVTDPDEDGVGTFGRHIYSRSQAFNSNNTYMLIYSYSGPTYWHLYNANPPYNKIKSIAAPSIGTANAEPTWDPVNPNVFYYFSEGGQGAKLYSYNVATEQPEGPAYDFNSRIKAYWPTATAVSTKAEGSSSADGQYWAFVVMDAAYNKLGYITWDKQTDTILGHMSATSANGFIYADHVSMSPSGKYVVISVYGGPGAVQFDREFNQIRQVGAVGEHSDMALLPNGHDAYVSVVYSAQPDEGDVYFYDMETGVKTVLFDIFENGGNSAIHFSGKGYNKPGWILVSTFSPGIGQRWYYDKVFALELTANPRIYPLAHHHQIYNHDEPDENRRYFTEVQATVNRDFTKILFTSNWDVQSNDVDDYMINLSASDIPASGTTTPVSVIVDNAATTGVTKVGTWTTSTFETARYGADYLHDGGTHSVTLTPTLPSAGTYSVYMMWPAGSNRASNVPVDILHAGVTSTVTVNQTTGGNQQWNLLGTYTFSAGTGGNVKIRTTATNGYVMADAVKFVKDTSVSVTVDNAASTGVTKVGTWTTSTFDTNRYGADYLHNGGIKSVTFTPTLPSAGTYSVYMMWPAGTNRATNAPVDILHAGVTSTVTVNQTTGGNQQWNLLGTYTFSAGTGG
ncbi:hypothetical protein ACFPPD_20995, partial [Cohnella suwonensis]